MAVASHDSGKNAPSRDVTGATWSNHGKWITCSAVGADVTPTFLHVAMGTEDDMDPHPVKNFMPTNTAHWSGTCFAAPNVTGSIAEQHMTIGSLTQPWNNVLSTLGATQVSGLGYVLPI
jgi:hypothetical protein